MVAKVFKLESPLYFSYTHLVCRTSKEGVCGGGLHFEPWVSFELWIKCVPKEVFEKIVCFYLYNYEVVIK